jgi:DNA-binding CsgD family transcriptional regulator
MKSQLKPRGNYISSSFLRLYEALDSIRLVNIRLKKLRFMLIFALAPVFANMQGTLFHNDERLFGLDSMTLMGSAYCIGAGFIFIFTRRENIVTVSHVSVIMTLAGFIPWMILPESQFSLCLAILFMFGFGGCAAFAAFSYIFALNNTERFFGVVIISAFCMIMQLDYGFLFISGNFGGAYLTMLVAGTVICIWSYRTEDFANVRKKPDTKLNPAILLTLYFFVAHKLVEILYTYFSVSSTPSALIFNCIVGLFTIVLALFMQILAKRSIWIMCNLFFVAMICSYALYFTTDGSVLRDVSKFLHGFEQMGYIASYYLFGCIFKKYGSFRLYKRCIIIILPGCLLLYMVPGIISAIMPEYINLISIAISSVVFIIFIMLSPAYAKYLFFADWSDEYTLADMNAERKHTVTTNHFENFGLTNREKEVAELLLRGYNAKQISAELGVKFNTARFHIKNLYKKLNIGSISEFFVRFINEKKTEDDN